ncbi:unnamed protein product [Larinioides sclopetarius]|uniref:Uncharacterized protein n=1 Tax=Larinioides sclopetarius TaxID=280406 RepID=A0AAV2BWF4_9ARAC
MCRHDCENGSFCRLRIAFECVNLEPQVTLLIPFFLNFCDISWTM